MEQKIICNGCGKEINTQVQDFSKIKKEWGYFSKKDMEIHEVCLCEECYDKWIASLKVPVDIVEKTEVL